MTLADVVFAAFVAFYAFRGFRRGLIREGFDLIGIVGGIGLGLWLYTGPGAALHWMGVPRFWASIVGGGLIFAAIFVGSVLAARKVQSGLGPRAETVGFQVGGASFAAAWATLFAIFVLVVITVIPAPRAIESSVTDSLLGRAVLSKDSKVYPILQASARREARDLLFYLKQYFTQLHPPTTDPSHEFFKLDPTSEVHLDPQAEVQILALVNKERRARGLRELKPLAKMREVARAHSQDMFVRGYFSHVDPDNNDPFQRMEKAGLTFVYAGENLALAPSVNLVHRGLMNSPKHKENILKPQFTDVGIGVFDGPYGLMVTQNFCSGCR